MFTKVVCAIAGALIVGLIAGAVGLPVAVGAIAGAAIGFFGSSLVGA